jgi:hypothetical protein
MVFLRQQLVVCFPKKCQSCPIKIDPEVKPNCPEVKLIGPVVVEAANLDGQEYRLYKRPRRPESQI